MAETETKKVETVSKEEHDKVVEELAKSQEAYGTLVNAFNKLLQEYNEQHVALLLKK